MVALMAGAVAARATTENAAPASGTNPEAAMTALFGNPPVVKAKGFEIKRADLDQVVSAARSNLTAANQPVPADLDAQVVDQLISIQVLLQTATPADRAAGKIDADQQYTNLLAQFKSPEDFPRLLKARGMTVDDLRSKAEQEAIAKAALKRELNATVSDEEAKDYFTKHAADFELPERAHVRHILLASVDLSTRPPTPLPTNTVAAKRKQAEDILKKIRGGADFAELARQYSDDGSKDNGGELPVFVRASVDPYHAMVPEFETAAFALTNGEVSDIVTSQYGFHIIKMIEKTPAKKYGFTDPIPEAQGDTPEKICKARLEALKLKQMAPDYVKKLRAEQQVEILDPELKNQEQQFQASQAAAAASESATPAPPAK